MTSISVTEAAKQHLSSYLLEQNAHYLILNVTPTGCVGFTYHFQATKEVVEHEYLLVQLNDKCSLAVLHESIPYIEGTVIDYVSVAFTKHIVINNPNIKNRCVLHK